MFLYFLGYNILLIGILLCGCFCCPYGPFVFSLNHICKSFLMLIGAIIYLKTKARFVSAGI